MFKTEMHLHTPDVSTCANAPVTHTIARYVKEGYRTIVVTNHLSRFSFGDKYPTWSDKIDHFMSGFNHFKEMAGNRLHVLLGCEIRLNTDENDYLLYGITESFLRTNENLMDKTIKELSSLCKSSGIILIQAHPFRNHMTIVDPRLLDGIEVYNGLTNPSARNDMAAVWAERFSLLPVSGSDYHDVENHVDGGIVTENEITTNEQLIKLMKMRQFKLIRTGAAAF